MSQEQIYDFDLAVIGGGSAGIAAAKTAAQLGKRVVVCDKVTPTPRGYSWGVGGTSINVGCMPKKLMHRAAVLGLELRSADDYGWSTGNVEHSWRRMVDNIQEYVHKRNAQVTRDMDHLGVTWKSYFAEITAPNTITLHDFTRSTLTAHYIILATGSRPRYVDIPGARELSITSDDFFSLPQCPGNTLVVGAGYVGLELAGIIIRLGMKCTVMTCERVLSSMDHEMMDKVEAHMTLLGVKFLKNSHITALNDISSDETSKPPIIKAHWRNGDKDESGDFNCVLLAVGRGANTSGCGLENVGVTLDKHSGLVIVDKTERTSIPDVFAVGDVAFGRAQLTPVAVKAAQLLVKRLFTSSQTLTDLSNIPTTLYTPLEYGCVGISQEEAELKFGAENIEVLSSHFQPLEFELLKRQEDNFCFCKLICVKNQNGLVVGLHILSPNAGEITQGFAIGLKTGATKAHFAALMGIHPTCAEWFTRLQ